MRCDYITIRLARGSGYGALGRYKCQQENGERIFPSVVFAPFIVEAPLWGVEFAEGPLTRVAAGGKEDSRLSMTALGLGLFQQEKQKSEKPL